MKHPYFRFCRTLAGFVPINLLFFCATYGFMIFFTGLGMCGIDLLHVLARFQFYLCAYIAAVSFYAISSANRAHVKEALEAIAGSNRFETRLLGSLALLFGLWNAGALLILVSCSLRNDGTRYFLGWFPSNYLVNVLLPQIICLLLTYLAARSRSYHRLLLAELMFLFFISPLMEKIVWPPRSGFPITVIWEKLRWPFTILYQNSEWSPDLQNSMQMEYVRIAVSLFWLLLFTALSIGKRRRRLRALTALGAVLALAYSFLPASIYRLGFPNPNGNRSGIFADYETYGLFTADNAYHPKAADFLVTDYALDVRLGNQLRVTANLQLESSADQTEFLFTLYHGYHIKKAVSLTDGIAVEARRDEDTVLLCTDRPVQSLRLHLEYEGFHAKFYSNYQAAMLPGWFPWYPMAGEKQVFLEYPTHGGMYGYNPYNRIAPAHITLTCGQTIVTNLSRTDEHSYSATADSITLISGNVIPTDDCVIADYLPLYFTDGDSPASFLSEQKEAYTQALFDLDARGVDTSKLRGKRILFASKDMARNVSNNWIAVFDDYILTIPGYLNADELYNYLTMEEP